MIVDWPNELPKPERDTWNVQRQDARSKRRSEAGPPSWRRRFSNAAKSVSLSMHLDRDRNAIFDNFYQYDTAEGTRLFWMPDPTTDCWSLLSSTGEPLLISGGDQDGQPILLSRLWLCSFGDQMPTEQVVGIQFRRSFSVVVMP